MSRFRQPYQRNPDSSRRLNLGLLFFGAGILLFVVWLAVSSVRLARAFASLQEQQQRVELLLASGAASVDGQELAQIVTTVRKDVLEIEQVAGPFAGLGQYLGWLPAIGPIMADARPLLDMADAGSELAAYAHVALSPLLADSALPGVQQPDAPLTESLFRSISALDAAGADLVRADLAAERLFHARSALAHESDYPESLAALVRHLDDNTDLLHDGLKLAQVAPELLGLDRPKTYLILAQNEDELRPTGGFISGAGRLTVDQGRVVGLTFDNANLVDDWRNKPYDLPPAPFTEFMGMDIFLLRDANFWPDFAESASQTLALYSYGQDVPLDGVVAIDQQFMQQLLAATGPLPVPDLNRIVDAANVVSQLREEWGPGGDGAAGGDGADWIIERKAFMAPLAAAFLAQLQGGLPTTSGLDLVEMLLSAARQRHLQLFSADPAVSAILDQTVWSGRMGATGQGDFLHVADTNMGFNKVNAAVVRSLTYSVDLAAAAGPTAQLKVHYRNPPSTEPVDCLHGTRYGPDTRYESLTSDCYWNYLRVYVPGGSQLTESSAHPVPAASLMSGLAWPGIARSDSSIAGALTVFDNFLLLATGEEATVSFQYALPATVLAGNGHEQSYRLHIRKQAGSAADAATVQITLPQNATLLKASPQPAVGSGETLTFEPTLNTDVMIEILYDK